MLFWFLGLGFWPCTGPVFNKLDWRGRQTCPETPGPALDESLRVVWSREGGLFPLLEDAPDSRSRLSSCFVLSVWYQSVTTWLVLVVLSVCGLYIGHLFTSAPMGQQLTTPLSLTLDHCSEVLGRACNESVKVKKKKWQTFCSSEWPTFQVCWPWDRTFNLDTILQVKARVFQAGPHRHPDQVPYIVTWENLARDPPSWVRPFLPPPHPPTHLPPSLGPRPAPLPSPVPLLPSPSSPSAPPLASSLFPLNESQVPIPKPKPLPILPRDQDNLLLLDPRLLTLRPLPNGPRLPQPQNSLPLIPPALKMTPGIPPRRPAACDSEGTGRGLQRVSGHHRLSPFAQWEISSNTGPPQPPTSIIGRPQTPPSPKIPRP